MNNIKYIILLIAVCVSTLGIYKSGERNNETMIEIVKLEMNHKCKRRYNEKSVVE